MKFAINSINLPTDISNAIIDEKAEAKKNGKSLTNSDIVLKALQLYYSHAVKINATQPNTDELKIDIADLIDDSVKPLQQKFDYESQGFFTNEQTAKYVSCNEAEINKAHANGTLKYTRFGRIQHNHIDDINKWNLERIKQKTA
ncbi:MAG: hypothetical protein SPL21_10100 [Fibrobacter sp.]|nr:hypothetical protein [Fibrobacter sp.]